MTLSADACRMIAVRMDAAPRGQKGAAVAALAAELGVSEATVHRHRPTRGPRRKRNPQRPEYREWVDKAVAIARAEPHKRPLALDLAIRAGIESRTLPPEAAAMPLGTAYRLAREAGYGARRRYCRIDAEFPGQGIQIDGSTSAHLMVVEQLDAGDWLLKVHRSPLPASGYKNKPLSPTRARLIVNGAWDVCTGAVASRYLVARGENGMDTLAFAVDLFHGRHEPIRGLPDDLWSDLGPFAKHASVKDFLRRAGVKLRTGEAYAKARMGGVERSHKSRWGRFERGLLLLKRDTMRLSEVNDRLAHFEVEMNARPARTPVDGRMHSRATTWGLLALRRPEPLRELRPDALDTVFREVERRVTVRGTVSWDSVEYEVGPDAAPRLIGRWVKVRRRLDADDQVTVEDCKTGLRATGKPLLRRAYGDIRTSPKLPVEALLERSEELPPVDIWGERPAPPPEKVVAIRPATMPAAPLADPTDVPGRHADLPAAMSALQSLCGLPLSAAARIRAEDHLLRADLSHDAVRALAASIARAASG